MAMGGADKFNLDLIKQLKGRGYEISIATTLAVNYAWYQEFANLTPDIFILPNFLRLNDYPRFLYYLIQSRQFDFVLVSNSGFGYKLLPYLRSRLPDTVFVDFCHMEEEYWNNGGHPRHAVAYQDLLDLNIVSSQHLKEWMIQRGADQSQIEVCYTNIDTELLFPDSELRLRVRSELGIASEIPVILYAGRICEQKQPQVFAKVMAELQARNLEYICLVAGDGEDRKWLARFLRRNNLTSQVRMLGAVSNARVRELMAASDIFFLPSKMEGIALTIFETMAMGIVPVGADVGGQKELVTAECGILIQRSEEEQEVEVYSDALQKLLESPELRASMGQAARDRVCSHFQIEQMGQRMEALLVKSEQLHRMRPKPAIGPGLGTEHAVLAIEGQRTLRAAGGLWKYQRVESATRRMSGLILPKMARLKGLAWRLRNFIQPLRKVKDAIWIVGHQAKVRLFDLEE
jgi:glycosyltransferase involved in cell wall biosynthesis